MENTITDVMGRIHNRPNSANLSDNAKHTQFEAIHSPENLKFKSQASLMADLEELASAMSTRSIPNAEVIHRISDASPKQSEDDVFF